MPARRVDPTMLVGNDEIAERAGVATSTVHKWRQRHDHFPKPFAVLLIGPVWYWPDVEKWLDKTGR